MRGAWREGVVEGEDIVVGRGLALGWGGLDDVVFVVDRVGVSIPIIQVGRKISVSFFFFLSLRSFTTPSFRKVGTSRR